MAYGSLTVIGPVLKVAPNCKGSGMVKVVTVGDKLVVVIVMPSVITRT